MKALSSNQLYLLEKSELNCREFERLCSDYCDGELPESLKLKFEEHRDSCPLCHEFSESYAFVISAAKMLKPAALPDDVKARLRAGLKKELGIDLT